MERKNTKNIEFTFLYIITFTLYCSNNFVDRFSLFYFGSYAYIYKALIYLIWLFIAVFSFRKKASIYMNIFICILFIYMFFHIFYQLLQPSFSFQIVLDQKLKLILLFLGWVLFLYYRFFMLYLMRYLAMLTSKKRLLICWVTYLNRMEKLEQDHFLWGNRLYTYMAFLLSCYLLFLGININIFFYWLL